MCIFTSANLIKVENLRVLLFKRIVRRETEFFVEVSSASLVAVEDCVGVFGYFFGFGTQYDNDAVGIDSENTSAGPSALA